MELTTIGSSLVGLKNSLIDISNQFNHRQSIPFKILMIDDF